MTPHGRISASPGRIYALAYVSRHQFPKRKAVRGLTAIHLEVNNVWRLNVSRQLIFKLLLKFFQVYAIRVFIHFDTKPIMQMVKERRNALKRFILRVNEGNAVVVLW